MSHRLPIGIILLILFPGIFFSFLKAAEAILQRPGWLVPFMIGTVFGVVFDLFIVRKNSLLYTFLHELGHAFAATRYSGGQVYYSVGFGERNVELLFYRP
jgi:hypothetical protein